MLGKTGKQNSELQNVFQLSFVSKTFIETQNLLHNSKTLWRTKTRR